MTQYRIFIIPIFLFVIMCFTSIIIAQSGECPAIVQQAFESVEIFCSELSRNSACYGSTSVEASFYQEVDDDVFTVPGDLAQLPDIETIHTFPLDIENELWGVAVLQVQANIPNTLPGQNVVFLLLGEAQITDDVPIDASPSTADPVPVTVSGRTNVRSGPSLRNNVITTLDAGAAVAADGLSENGDWVRVIIADERPGWIFADLLEGDVEALPIVGAVYHAPMQAFHMTTGIGTPDCVEAPDAVLIQGIEDYEIEFVVNGANIRIGSTAILEMVDEDVMQLTMVDGTGWVDDLRIPAGWKAQIAIDPENGTSDPLGIDGLPEAEGQWMNCLPLDEFDRARIQSLTAFPEDVLNYPITVPRSGVGDCVSPDAATGNPAPARGGATQSQLPDVSCETFALGGPFIGISPRPTQFYWTEAPGATEYELVLYSVFTGQVAATLRTTQTSIQVVLGDIEIGSEIQWEVRAYRNGAYACVTYRTDVITLVADPVPRNTGGGGASGGGAGPFTAVWTCTNPAAGEFVIDWFNLPAGTTGINVDYFVDSTGANVNFNVGAPPTNGSSGTLIVPPNGPAREAHAGTITAAPGGQVAAINPFDLQCGP